MKVLAGAGLSAQLNPETLERMREKDRATQKLLAQLEASGETAKQRQERMERQAKEAKKKRERDRKANQLKGRIAFLRSRIMANPNDKTARGEMAMAKCQLYWTTNPFSGD